MNHIALTTFKEQVELFKKNCLASQQPLGNTLFIIWFGANDLYTANQKAEVMPAVAQEIAGRQRKILAEFVKLWNLALLKQACACKFIFVDLCRPLTSVRYTKRLQDAEALVRAQLGKRWAPAPAPRLGGAVHGTIHQSRNTLNLAKTLKLLPPSSWYQKKNIVELLEEQITVTKNLEKGVYLFNSTLKKTANENGDRVAEVGDCISEDSLRRLVQANYRLKAGAMGARVSQHVGSNDYDRIVGDEFTTTVDQVHPTDQMYKLIWLEIREVIRRSNCTFGGLNLVPAVTPFPYLSVVPTLQAHDAVMNQIGASPQDRLTRTNHGLW